MNAKLKAILSTLFIFSFIVALVTCEPIMEGFFLIVPVVLILSIMYMVYGAFLEDYQSLGNTEES